MASSSSSSSSSAAAATAAPRIFGGGGGSSGVLEGAGGSAEALFLSLGGPAAFQSLRDFPASHRELREEMARLHLGTRMAPGTLDSAVVLRPEVKKQQLQQQQRKQRKTDRRALQLTTAGHLDDKTREAVQKAAEDNLRKLITSQNQQQQR